MSDLERLIKKIPAGQEDKRSIIEQELFHYPSAEDKRQIIEDTFSRQSRHDSDAYHDFLFWEQSRTANVIRVIGRVTNSIGLGAALGAVSYAASKYLFDHGFINHYVNIAASIVGGSIGAVLGNHYCERYMRPIRQYAHQQSYLRRVHK